MTRRCTSLPRTAAAASLADLYLGKVAGPRRWCALAGKDDVAGGGPVRLKLQKEGSWRDHTVFDLKAEGAEKLTLKGGGNQVKAERLPSQNGPDGKPQNGIFDAKWKMAEGDLKPGGELDNALINRLVQGAAGAAGGRLRYRQTGGVGARGGAPGQIEVQISFKDNKSVGLRIGQLKWRRLLRPEPSTRGRSSPPRNMS